MILLWLKDKWKWIAGGLILLATFLLGVLARRPKHVVLPPVDADQKKVEKEIDAKEQDAEKKKDEEVTKIEQEHAAVLENLTEEEKKKYEELKGNPDELSGWLIDLGKKNRS